jgi:ATP-dependent Clp protease ATP-binding subunit ClpA
VTMKDDKLAFEIIEASLPALPKPEGESEDGTDKEPEAVE